MQQSSDSARLGGDGRNSRPFATHGKAAHFNVTDKLGTLILMPTRPMKTVFYT